MIRLETMRGSGTYSDPGSSAADFLNARTIVFV